MAKKDEAKQIAAENVRRAWELFKVETDTAGRFGLAVALQGRMGSRPRQMSLLIEEESLTRS